MALTRLSAAQARVLCLHYYSNNLPFTFDEPEEEVYRDDRIKEWDPVDPGDLEHFLQCVLKAGTLHEQRSTISNYKSSAFRQT